MKKRKYLRSGLCKVVMAGLLAGVLTGCGNSNIAVVDVKQEAIVEETTAAVKVAESAGLPVEEIAESDILKLLAGEIDHVVEIKSHEVSVTDDTNSEDGKYDLMDKVNVSVSFDDKFCVIPQTINKDVYFMRDAVSGQWEAVKENCRKWDTKFKQFGGTSWKMKTAEGDIYFRLRDTIEFFSTQPDKKAERVEETKFSTTILGAMYMNVDGEPVLRRIHVMSGTLTASGDIKLYLEFPPTTESMEINLGDCEKIERDELPFTEEEYKEAADQR